MIVTKYADVTYLVADGGKRPPRVVHFDRLKEYRGDKHPGCMNGYLEAQAADSSENEEENYMDTESEYDASAEETRHY